MLIKQNASQSIMYICYPIEYTIFFTITLVASYVAYTVTKSLRK
jgi:hypothetical protein